MYGLSLESFIFHEPYTISNDISEKKTLNNFLIQSITVYTKYSEFYFFFFNESLNSLHLLTIGIGWIRSYESKYSYLEYSEVYKFQCIHVDNIW